MFHDGRANRRSRQSSCSIAAGGRFNDAASGVSSRALTDQRAASRLRRHRGAPSASTALPDRPSRRAIEEYASYREGADGAATAGHAASAADAMMASYQASLLLPAILESCLASSATFHATGADAAHAASRQWQRRCARLYCRWHGDAAHSTGEHDEHGVDAGDARRGDITVSARRRRARRAVRRARFVDGVKSKMHIDGTRSDACYLISHGHIVARLKRQSGLVAGRRASMPSYIIDNLLAAATKRASSYTRRKSASPLTGAWK